MWSNNLLFVFFDAQMKDTPRLFPVRQNPAPSDRHRLVPASDQSQAARPPARSPTAAGGTAGSPAYTTAYGSGLPPAPEPPQQGPPAHPPAVGMCKCEGGWVVAFQFSGKRPSVPHVTPLVGGVKQGRWFGMEKAAVSVCAILARSGCCCFLAPQLLWAGQRASQ